MDEQAAIQVVVPRVKLGAQGLEVIRSTFLFISACS
jgi:hypothetical protein